MKRIVLLITLSLLVAGCSHSLEITNLNENFAVPPSPPKETVTIGVVSSQMDDPINDGYIFSVVSALRRSGNFERVIYPYKHSTHRKEVASIVHLTVLPEYDGAGSNFFVNFPGFLIFAPAIWGYGYSADLVTMADISYPGLNKTEHMEVSPTYTFRQAEIDRTWTEIGWLEVGIIPLVGGLVFIQYDPDVTEPFISEVSSNYGNYVASKITDEVYSSFRSVYQEEKE